MIEPTTQVIYNGDCAFYDWCRRFAERRCVAPLSFISYDDPRSATLLAAYPRLFEQRRETIIALRAGVPPTVKFQACLTIARAMRTPWPQFAHMLSYVPTPLGDAAYDVVGWARPFLSRIVSK